jgi:hypothetical protein
MSGTVPVPSGLTLTEATDHNPRRGGQVTSAAGIFRRTTRAYGHPLNGGRKGRAKCYRQSTGVIRLPFFRQLSEGREMGHLQQSMISGRRKLNKM